MSEDESKEEVVKEETTIVEDVQVVTTSDPVPVPVDATGDCPKCGCKLDNGICCYHGNIATNNQ